MLVDMDEVEDVVGWGLLVVGLEIEVEERIGF